jgi:hypothetical protein
VRATDRPRDGFNGTVESFYQKLRNVVRLEVRDTRNRGIAPGRVLLQSS